MAEPTAAGLSDQARALLELGPDGLVGGQGLEQFRSLAAACYSHMLAMADSNRSEATAHALAGAQLLEVLHQAGAPQPDWVAVLDEQCCRYGAIWIHEQLGQTADADLAGSWCQQAIVLLDRLERFHTPPPEWIGTMGRRLREQISPPSHGGLGSELRCFEQLHLPPIPADIQAAEALVEQAREWLQRARAAGAHERCLDWVAQLHELLGERTDLLWHTLDSAFPVGDWSLQAWCAEHLLEEIGPRQGPVHRHLLLTRWQALLTMATTRAQSQADSTLSALLALAAYPPEADSTDPAATHPQAWLLLQNARLAQRRGQLVSARSLCLAVAALPPEMVSKGLCLEALEMAEPMAYVSGDLEEGRAIRSRIGQLLEPSGPCHADPYRPWRMELGADPAALKRWQAIRTLPARSRLEALTPALQEHPQATALAFGLLHTLHEAGMTGSERLMEDAGATIPRRLWLLQRHSGSSLEQEARERRWRALHPGWDCAWLHPGREAIARREDLPALVIAACRAVNAAEVRADLLRLAVLWQHGGLAADWDCRPQRSLLPLVEPGTSLLLATDHLGCLGLEAIAATPRHPFVQSALEGACRSVLQGEGFSRWELSGACLLSGCFSRWMGPHLQSMEQSAAGLPAGVRVLSMGELQGWLSLGIPLPRPAGPSEEPTWTEVIDNQQRRRSIEALRRQRAPAPSGA